MNQQALKMYNLSTDWAERINISRQATFDDKNKIVVPIQPIESDAVFFNQTIGVYITSQSAKVTWKASGELYQALEVGFGTAGYALAESIRPTLNRYRMYRFDRFPFLPGETRYLLSFTPEDYLRDVRLQVWEYIGTNQGSTNESLQKSINAVHQRVINTQEILNKINKKK
jgi:hypothetical protein